MGVRLEELPPAMRAQVLDAVDAPKRQRTTQRGAGRTATDGTCVPCGERFTSTTAWERHSDQTGHRRFELNLEEK